MLKLSFNAEGEIMIWVMIWVLQCRNTENELSDVFVFTSEKVAKEELRKAKQEYSYTKLESFYIK